MSVRANIIIIAVSLLFIIYSLRTNITERFTERPRQLAVIFSGRIKGYENIENHLRYIKDTYNATFFVSLNKGIRSAYIDTFCKKFSVGVDQIRIEQTKSPEWLRSFDVEYGIPGGKEGSGADHLYSMVYNIHSAFNMIKPYEEKNKMKFDCVMFYRADIDAEDELNITLPVENTVYIPYDYDWSGINNQIAYGTYDTMSKYSSLINNLQKLCGEDRVMYHPERLLKKHLENEGLQVIRFPFKYKLHSSRHDYNPEYDNYE